MLVTVSKGQTVRFGEEATVYEVVEIRQTSIVLVEQGKSLAERFVETQREFFRFYAAA